MATATASKMASKDGFSVKYDGSQPIREAWSVVVDSGDYTQATLTNATGLPKRGDFYAGTNSQVKDIDFDPQDDNNQVWTATVIYEPLQSNLGQFASDATSKNRLIALSFDTNVYTETIDSAYFVNTISKTQTPAIPDFSSKVITDNIVPTDNTAGDKIIGITETVRTKVMFLTQVEEIGYDPDKAQELIGYPNIDPITIAGTLFKAHEGLILKMAQELKNPTADTEGFPNGKYWQTQYQIERKVGGWYTKVVNEGFHQLVGTDKSVITNLNAGIDPKDGTPVSDPVKLNETGGLISHTSTDIFFQVVWSKFPKKWANIIQFVTER